MPSTRVLDECDSLEEADTVASILPTAAASRISLQSTMDAEQSWFRKKATRVGTMMSMLGKKQKPATMDEVEALKKQLLRQISKAKVDVEARARALAEEVRQEVESQMSTIRSERAAMIHTATEEIQANANATLQDLRHDITDLESEIDNEIKDSVKKVAEGVREERERELGAIRQEYDSAISSLHAELKTAIVASAADLSSRLERQLEDHRKALDALRVEDNEHWSSAEKHIQDEVVQRQQYQDRLRKEFEGRVAKQTDNLDRLEDRLTFIASDEVDGAATHRELDSKIHVLQEIVGSRLSRLDEQTKSLRVAVAEVENIPTRRVEWQLPNASELLQDVPAEGASFFSPEFEAGGTHGLQLEIKLSPEDEQNTSRENCELLLWGGECGLGLAIRLYIGAAYMDLQHSFRSLQPCTSGQLCSWAEQLDEDGSLHIGVEILESVREVGLPSRLSPTDDPESTWNFPWRRVEGSLVSHRHLIHRTLDLVQDQVDLIRSRTVRRVEWRIERASELRRCFPSGERLCSAPFDAGGLAGLQLVFYPSGHGDAREGHCSLYISCPVGTEIHCWLLLGKQRWEASSLSDTSAGYYGRASFCRFDGCFDERDDSILVAMELKEARQDVTVAQKAHPAPRQQTAGSQTAPIESVLSLRRAPAPGSLTEVKQLPSIWTEKVMSKAEDGDPDYHAFQDMRSVKRRPASGPRRIASGGRCRSPVMPRCRPTTPSDSPAPPWATAALGGPLGVPVGERYHMYASC